MTSNRPLDGQALANVLRESASVCAIADSLKMDLEPLSDEDIAAGAEPLSLDQIKAELEKISNIATIIALQYLKADSAEWYGACEAVDSAPPVSRDDAPLH